MYQEEASLIQVLSGFMGIIFILLLLGVGIGLFGNIIQTSSDGSQIGFVVSVDKTSQLGIGSTTAIYVKSDKSSSESISFCSAKDELIELAKDAARNEYKVELIYESYLITKWDQCKWQVTDIVLLGEE